MSYYDKYLKYKRKYLEIKNKLGGSQSSIDFQRCIDESYEIPLDVVNIQKCIDEFGGIPREDLQQKVEFQKCIDELSGKPTKTVYLEREFDFLSDGGLIDGNELDGLLEKIRSVGLNIPAEDRNENLLWKLISHKRISEVDQRILLESRFKCKVPREEFRSHRISYDQFVDDQKEKYIIDGLRKNKEKHDRYDRNFRANLSDHELLISNESDENAFVINSTISLNVGFWIDNKYNIIKYFKNLDEHIDVDTSTFNDLIKYIIKLKNQKIKNLLNQLINLPRLNRSIEIIINIQEGYPTLYRELVCGIKHINSDTYGIPTKLVCKNIFESFTNIQKDEADIEAKVNAHIQGIFNGTSSYNIGGRPHNNTNLFSIVIDIPSSMDAFMIHQQLFYDSIFRDGTIRYEPGTILTEDNEEIIGKHIIKKQEEIGEVFIAAEPILLTCKIAQKYSRMVDYGVGIGSVIIKCDGIRLLFKGVLNCHLEKDNLSFEHMFYSLSRPYRDYMLKEFTFGKFTDKGKVDDQQYIDEIKKTNIHLENQLYKEVIRVFEEVYFVSTPKFKSKPIKLIVGDFNNLRYSLQLPLENVLFSIVENKGLDYIITKLN